MDLVQMKFELQYDENSKPALALHWIQCVPS